jgi:hypothetical protein
LRRKSRVVCLEQVVVVAVQRACVNAAVGQGGDHAARIDEFAHGLAIKT